MLAFSLNTFIKICLLDTGSRISEIQRRLSSTGGYDFYKPLHRSIRAFASDGVEAAEAILDAPTNDVERKRNKEAFDSFRSKFGSSRSLEAVNAPKSLKFKDAGISISLDPPFEITKAGVRQGHSVWATQKPELTQRYGAVACHVMRLAYANSTMANSEFLYADLVNGKVYSERQISNNTHLILMSDVSSIGALVKEL